MNAKRSFYNVFFGLLSQMVAILLGIIIPRLVLVNLGSVSNGLLSSVNQTLVYLSLLEAGVGTATLQALYSRVAKNDRNSINSVLAAADIYYKRTGAIYFVFVVVLAVLYPTITKNDLPRMTVFLVVLFSGLSGAITYYFQAKYKILLQAEGKTYVITNLGMVINICASIMKIILLLAGRDVIVLQFMYMCFNLIQILYILWYIKKYYRWIDLSVKPDYIAISQSKSVIVHQISSLIFSNTDVVLLTMVCGLKVVSVYSMYVMLFGMISTVISTLNGGVSFVMGQTYHVDKERYNKLHNVFEVYNMCMTFSLYCIAGIFILPFLKLYTAGITDISYIDSVLPYLFISIQLLSNGRSASIRVIEFAGHFKLTQNRAIIESVLNIVVSIICVNIWGIYGVLFGTIAALIYRTNDMIIYAGKNILHRNPWITYRRWIVNIIVFGMITLIFSRIQLNLGSYFMIIIHAIWVSALIFMIFFVTSSITNREEFYFIMNFIREKLKWKKEPIVKEERV